MDLDQFKHKSFNELKGIGKQLDLPMKGITKSKLVQDIITRLLEYENYKKTVDNKYKKIASLGKPGKEGTTYHVKYRGRDYAMKTFKNKKSASNLEKEAKLLAVGAKACISPKVKEVNAIFKFIVMDKLDISLFDFLKDNNGILDNDIQIQLVRIFSILDKIGIFHADPNPLNFMFKGDKLYIIDYGFGKEIDDKLIKKYGTKDVNMKFMILGLILKIKNIFGERYPENMKYNILAKYISKEDRMKFGIE